MYIQPELKRMLWRGWAFLGLALALLGASLAGQTPRAAPLQQNTATDTPSPTPTYTASASPTVSPTGSLTPSVSVSPTATTSGTPQTQTLTPTAAFSPTSTLSPTSAPPPTLAPITPILPATSTPAPLVSPVVLETLPSATPAPPTATLKPFPLITYQYPGKTPTYTLLVRQGVSPDESPPKDGQFSPQQIWRSLVRAAPLLLLGGLWIGLGLWFLISQILLHRTK